MQEVKVSITQELIDKNRHRCNDCPVFDGMVAAGVPVKMVMSEYWIDGASPAGIGLTREHPSVHKLPEAASNWIKNYDEFPMSGTATVPKPIEFYISF